VIISGLPAAFDYNTLQSNVARYGLVVACYLFDGVATIEYMTEESALNCFTALENKFRTTQKPYRIRLAKTKQKNFHVASTAAAIPGNNSSSFIIHSSFFIHHSIAFLFITFSWNGRRRGIN